MRKGTKGIVIGSLAVGFVGGIIAIKQCLKDKDNLTDREKVEFKYLGKHGVSDTLNDMSDTEIHELAKALETVELFNTRVSTQRSDMLAKVVNTTLGVDYADFMDVMLNMYDSEEDILNESFCKLIDDYFEITGENIDADGEETSNDIRSKLKSMDELLKNGASEGAGELLKSLIEPSGDFNLEDYMNPPEDK